MGVDILANSGPDVEVVRGIRERHECWNGSGCPDGRRGDEMSMIAQNVASADTYHSLLSTRPDRPAFKPHGVKFNTGEVATVSNPNSGHLARPIVRIGTKDGKRLKNPYDRDLSLSGHMRILITEVLL